MTHDERAYSLAEMEVVGLPRPPAEMAGKVWPRETVIALMAYREGAAHFGDEKVRRIFGDATSAGADVVASVTRLLASPAFAAWRARLAAELDALLPGEPNACWLWELAPCPVPRLRVCPGEARS